MPLAPCDAPLGQALGSRRRVLSDSHLNTCCSSSSLAPHRGLESPSAPGLCRFSLPNAGVPGVSHRAQPQTALKIIPGHRWGSGRPHSRERSQREVTEPRPTELGGCWVPFPLQDMQQCWSLGQGSPHPEAHVARPAWFSMVSIAQAPGKGGSGQAVPWGCTPEICWYLGKVLCLLSSACAP